MTKTELDNLIVESKRLDSAADSGPWATLIQGNGESQYCDIVQAEDTCAIVCVMSNSYRELDNAEFIAHSRTALSALVAEVERLSALVERVEEIARQAYMDGIDLERLCPNDAENKWEKSCTWNNLQMSKEGHAWQVVE